jgi:hypothetical protein
MSICITQLLTQGSILNNGEEMDVDGMQSWEVCKENGDGGRKGKQVCILVHNQSMMMCHGES